MDPEQDAPQPSDFVRSAILFFVTMSTVFGLGMLWTTSGEKIAFQWRRDWYLMKERWTEATAPKGQEKNPSLLGVMPGRDWNQEFDRVNQDLSSSYGRRDRSVVPVIDTRKPGRN